MAKRQTSIDGGSSHKRPRYDDTPAPEMFYIFQGEVASVKDYGLFVKLPGTRRQGLVHKSQICKAKVDDPSDMYARGEMVYCKVISLGEGGEKIGLAMKTVNQSTGHDLDPNNIELSQDERRRRQGGGYSGRQKIELEAVFDTTCKKCGGSGHLAQDCFQTGDGKYDLIPDLDDYMKSVKAADTQSTSKKKHKKEKKIKKKKKDKKKKKHRNRSSSESESSDDSKTKKKKKYKKSYDSSSDSNGSYRKHMKKNKKRKKHRSSSSSDG